MKKIIIFVSTLLVCITLLFFEGCSIATAEELTTKAVSNINSNPVIIASDQIETIAIEIGDWNMLLTEIIFIELPFEREKIINIDIWIRGDDYNIAAMPLDQYKFTSYPQPGGYFNVEPKINRIRIYRTPGGLFYNTNYNNTGWNRGWIIITKLIG